MQKSLLTLFLSLFYASLRCQSISGVVLDSLKTPVSYCAVGLLNQKDSTVVKGNLTDEDGKFTFESISPGKYLIKIHHAGFRETWSPLVVLDSLKDVELQPIVLNNSGIKLNEVDVVAIKAPIEFKGGNLTVNIDGSPLAIGNTVYDLLSRLPGVMVENDKISIQGKSGARIYIDDRPQQLSGPTLINLLKSMNASSVEKIEVISNPPAKYDAAGNAGIINIKTKKIRITGFSGSTNLTYSQGFYENTNGGFSLNYKGKKFTFFSNLNGSQGIKHNVSTFKKTVSYNGQDTEFDQRLTDDYDNRNADIELGADWFLNKKDILGAKVRIMPGYGINNISSTTLLSDTSLGYDQLSLKKSLPNDWVIIDYNVNAEHSFDTLGTKLKFSADYYYPNYDYYYGDLKNTYANTLNNTSRDSFEFRSNNKLDFQIVTVRLDFEKKLSKTLGMEAGLKKNDREITSDYLFEAKDRQTGEYRSDPAFTNVFHYTEKINAGYLTFNKELKKFNLQAGLRAENTSMYTRNEDQTVSNRQSYFNLFPVVSIDYNHSKNHVYSLAYTKRIERPEFYLLNPYKSFTDLLNSYEGNPYLRPAYSHNLNFNYVLKNSIYNSLSYTRYLSPLSGYNSQNDSTKETIQRVTNLDHFEILRYSFFMRKNIRKWWTLSFNFGTYYVAYSGKLNGQQYALSAVPYYLWINNVFVLRRNVKMEIMGYYWSPWLGIAYRYKQRAAMSLAVKKSFFDNTLNCSVGVNDIFFSEVFRSSASFQNQSWERFESQDTRRLNISVSYSFGKIRVEKRNLKSDEDPVPGKK